MIIVDKEGEQRSLIVVEGCKLKPLVLFCVKINKTRALCCVLVFY